MGKFTLAACSHLRGVVLCTLVTVGLAACGSDEGSSATTAAVGSDSFVSPSVGLIDRSPGESGTTTPSSNSTTASTSTPGTTGTTPPSTTTPPVASTGTATLDWTPPTQNSDGSVLTNLAGYTVYYGTSANQLTQSVKVSNPGLTAYTLSNLPAGTWYFAVTSYSSSGVESVRSGVVSTKI
jgi:hypothetical protein